jgi:hypothetical protein
VRSVAIVNRDDLGPYADRVEELLPERVRELVLELEEALADEVSLSVRITSIRTGTSWQAIGHELELDLEGPITRHEAVGVSLRAGASGLYVASCPTLEVRL